MAPITLPVAAIRFFASPVSTVTAVSSLMNDLDQELLVFTSMATILSPVVTTG